MTYRCPVCHQDDENLYLTCNHPACPDGRDQARFEVYRQTYEPPKTPKRWPLWWIAMAAFLALAYFTGKANAHGKHDPNSPTTKWIERQMRPDKLPAQLPCCGVSDSYPVDRYTKFPNGDYEVWIKDGSEIEFRDGSRRRPWDVTVPIIVPKAFINPEDDDLDNPTDTSWLFFRPSNETSVGVIYCFIRHPMGN